jgi:hypothetical protein
MIEDDDDLHDPLDDLRKVLAERTEYVITFHRLTEVDMDTDPNKNAFAFLIGSDSDNAIVVEGDISGDGMTATATVWAVSGGKRADMSMIEIDGQIMHSIPLA